MKKIRVALCVCCSLGLAAWGASTGRVYRQQSMTLGTLVRSETDCTMATSDSTVVPSTPTLAFPGITVADLVKDKYTIYGFFCGGMVANSYKGKPAAPMHFQAHTNEEQVVDKAFGTLSIVEGGENTYAKGVSIEYTDGLGGVYAKAFSARYTKSDWIGERFVSMAADGTYIYHHDAANVATAWHTGGAYGIAGLTATRFIRPDELLPVWANGADEAILTLDDIKDYDFHGFMAGPSVNLDAARVEGYNKRLVMDADGHVTQMTIEFQLLDDKYVKCVVVDFENGASGIVGKARGARYKELASGGALGFAFVKDDGSFDGTGSGVALGWTSVWGGNYAVYELTATPPPPSVDLVLDRSKTWTELVAGVDLGARDLKLNITVTGENPTLTFDTVFDSALVVFTGTGDAGTFTVKGSGAAFTLDRMKVDKALTLNMDERLMPTTLELGNHAKVVYASEGTATITSVITGAGGVEIAAGTVTMKCRTSDYTGGTRVKAGAIVRPGCGVTSRENLYVGPFGVVSRGNLVTVEPGGLYDVNGMDSAGVWVAGQGLNPIVNTGTALDWHKHQTWGLVLTGDMELAVTNEFGLITARHESAGGLSLSGKNAAGEDEHYTLRKTGPAPFSMAGNPMSILGYGTLQISEGPFTIVGNGALNGTGAKLKIDPGVIVTNKTDINVNAIENNGTIFFEPRAATNRIDGTNWDTGYTGTGTVVVTVADKRLARLTFLNGPGRRYVLKKGRTGPCRRSRPTQYYAFNTTEEPLLNQRVDVEPGATFDLLGLNDVNVSVTLAGTGHNGMGALANTGGPIIDTNSQIVQLTLADDATVCGVSDFGVLAPSYKPTRVELGTHTLTLDTAARFFFSYATLAGTGGFDVRRGTLNFRGSLTYDAGTTMDIRVGAEGVLDNDMALTVRNFENGGVVTNDASMITVTGTVTGTGAAHATPKLTLADGATIKVADAATPLVVSQSLTATGTLTLDLEGLEMVGDVVPLLVAPAGTDLSGVTYTGRNVPPGMRVAVRNGLPSLVKGGICVYIR